MDLAGAVVQSYSIFMNQESNIKTVCPSFVLVVSRGKGGKGRKTLKNQ